MKFFIEVVSFNHKLMININHITRFQSLDDETDRTEIMLNERLYTGQQYCIVVDNKYLEVLEKVKKALE